MKIISWNINGIKSWSETSNVFDFLEKENIDILCVQEIKTSEEKVKSLFSNILEEFNFHYYHFAEKKGYSGTAIFSKYKPKKIDFGLKNNNSENIDTEGRMITLEFENFFLVNVYTPNSKIDFSRLDYRVNIWDSAFLEHLKRLKEKKEVVVCGDMNVLERDIDLQNYTYYFKNDDFREKILKERKSFERYINSGFEDIYRMFYPEKVIFSWVGPVALSLPSTRLDYFLLTKKIKKKVQSVEIINNQKGSDHFPISLEINFNNLKKENLREKIFFPEGEVFQESLF